MLLYVASLGHSELTYKYVKMWYDSPFSNLSKALVQEVELYILSILRWNWLETITALKVKKNYYYLNISLTQEFEG